MYGLIQDDEATGGGKRTVLWHGRPCRLRHSDGRDEVIEERITN